MSTPFDNIQFGAPNDSMTNDEVIRILNSTNGPSISDALDIRGGIKRVNDNTADTGVVAYRDEKGQAVLTNVARDPITSKEKPIAALLRSPVQTDSTNQPQQFDRKPDTPLNIFESINLLRKSTTTWEEATGIMPSLQASIAEQISGLRKQSMDFAEQKLGLKQLESELQAARAADRADPAYIPGMGDSPITRKIVDDMVQLRVLADREAKGFLEQNPTWRSLDVALKTAEAEFKRIEQTHQRKTQLELNAQMSRDNAAINRQAMTEELRIRQTQQREDELLQKYEGLSAVQLQRLNILHTADLEAFSTSDERSRKLKTINLVLNNKDKKYQEAITAETSQQLLHQALQGNQYSRRLIIAEEAANTGQSEAEVAAKLESLARELADPAMAHKVLQSRRGMRPEDAKKMAGDMNAAAFAAQLDPNKKRELDANKMTLLLEYAQNKVNEQFLSDVSSWGLTDPRIVSAIDRSVKVTGQRNIQNVMAAFIGDATEEERLARLKEFDQMITDSFNKKSKSVFGKPDVALARRMVQEELTKRGFFSRMYERVLGRGIAQAGPLSVVATAAQDAGVEAAQQAASLWNWR